MRPASHAQNADDEIAASSTATRELRLMSRRAGLLVALLSTCHASSLSPRCGSAALVLRGGDGGSATGPITVRVRCRDGAVTAVAIGGG